MTVGDWILLVFLLAAIASTWGMLMSRLAVLKTQVEAATKRLVDIETNHLPTLTKQNLEHMEEIVKLTVRMETIAKWLEKLERRLNGE